MRRNKGRVCRDGGVFAKRDTPAKVTETRQKTRRLQLRNVYEALPEERLVSPAAPGSPVTINIQPVNSKTVLSVRSAARDEVQSDLCASVTAKKKPARPSVLHTISELGPLKTHNEIVPTVKEQDGRNLAATPESEINFSVESDTTSNSDDDNEDCYSSSNTLSSPEIFRGENEAEPEPSCSKPQHMGLHPIIANSTLLDTSCAQSIYMHRPPDLSAINNASSVLVEKCEINKTGRSEGDSQRKKRKSDNDINSKTPATLTRKKTFLCKKVVFKSPIITEYPCVEVKRTPASKCTAQYTSDPVQTLSPADQVKPGEKASGPAEMGLSRLKLRSSVKGGAEKASISYKTNKFFDFVSDADKDVFFRMARERSVKLRSAPLLPLSAAKHAVPSVW